MRATPGVVVLNASYEPLGIVSLARALVYLVRERAVIVDAVPGMTVKSASAELPLPRVVQFREMVRAPYRWAEEPWSRRGVIRRDDHSCAYCGRAAATVDHVLPRSRGGQNTWLNTVAACASCNGKKADRTPLEAGMVLRRHPRVVTRRDTLIVGIASTGADIARLGIA
ncbi:MAG: HNH endonuclease [Microbacterium sp.]|uniref:HNH endonuclease n=1 Tax=uncultured Microbacterium sp. TaxID=191216 RepID=UPI000C996059|nr:HNH endonuclease [Microbacterium sp.]